MAVRRLANPPDLDPLFGPGSGFPPYPQPTGPPTGPPVEPPPPPKLNTLAVLAFVLAFVVSPAAIALGVIARGQIRRTGESGNGLATAAVVVGSVLTVVGVAAAAVLASVLFKAIPTLYPSPALAAPTPATAAPPLSRSAADLARDLSGQLARGGNLVHDATCPEDLQAIPGQTERCTVVFSDGQPVDLVVTVTSADGESIRYEFRLRPVRSRSRCWNPGWRSCSPSRPGPGHSPSAVPRLFRRSSVRRWTAW